MDQLSSKGEAYYTRRDIILYALGIGCCSHNNAEQEKQLTSSQNSELRYVYEHHDEFTPLPTFLLTLAFRAQNITSVNRNDSASTCSSMRHTFFDLPSFPTSLMKQVDIYKMINFVMEDHKSNPKSGNQKHDRSKIKAIIHLSEKLRIHQEIPNSFESTHVHVKTNIISILPKQIGIIVIAETEYFIHTRTSYSNDDTYIDKPQHLLATSQMATLYILLEDEKNSIDTSQIMCSTNHHTYISCLDPIQISKDEFIDYVKTNKAHRLISHSIPNNQALIYRLSGDTNSLHVISSSSPFLINTSVQPILHGLCTLGYGVRSVLSYCYELLESNDIIPEERQKSNFKFVAQPHCEYISCQFVKPVFVGDTIQTSIWKYDRKDQAVMSETTSKSVSLLFFFQIIEKVNQVVVVDNGIMEVKFRLESTSSLPSSSLPTSSLPTSSNVVSRNHEMTKQLKAKL